LRNVSSLVTERPDPHNPGPQQAFDPHQIISLATPTTAAFVGRTQRGPLNEPVTVTSFDAYRRVFGHHVPFSHVSHAVQQYFQCGGQVATIVRLANRATRAAIDLPAGAGALHLQARQPGGHEYLRVSVDYDQVGDSPHLFNLVVQRLSRRGSELIEDQEIFNGMSMTESDPRFVVDALKESDLVRLSGPLPLARPDATRPKHPGAPIPYLAITAPGSDGEELSDYDIVGSRDEATGLFALDRLDGFDLLCIPAPPERDFGITTYLAAERYCERRRAMLIWDPPAEWRLADTALIGMRTSAQSSVNAVTYFPRVRARVGLAGRGSALPASGIVAGLLAAADEAGHRRATQWPAVRLSGWQPVLAVTARQSQLLGHHGINVFTPRDGGYELSGNVTMAGPHTISSAAQQLDRRRLGLFIVSRIERRAGLWRATHERADAWQTLAQQLTAFFTRLYATGALVGQAEAQAYYVKWRPRAGSGALSIGFALDRPADFVRYVLEPSGATLVLTPASPAESAQLAG
jgi:hypothetical protein